MLDAFTTAIEDTVKNENQLTENGAVGYKTAGSALVDFCFKVSSYRNLDIVEIINDFSKVYMEDPLLAVKMMFMAGDIRGGMGERRLFNTCLQWLAVNHPDVAKAVIPLVAEYNRWDAVVNLYDGSLGGFVSDFLKKQLDKDYADFQQGKSISLLAKWMPSVNTSSKTKCALARKLAKTFKMTERQYRKTLSALRNHLNVVETKMSAGDWSEIDYNAVPSKANLLYRNAFLAHDGERRQQFLDDLEAGKNDVKINSGASFPYDIIHKYTDGGGWYSSVGKYDATLEEMWKALPNYVGENGSDTICMVDGSGSMGSRIGNTQVTAHDVARSLGIYFAERMQGAFHNKYISFGANPHLVDFGKCQSLRDKIAVCVQNDDCSNTNIEKAFMLILTTATKHGLKQNEIPKNILIISDMEFDGACEYPVYDENSFNAYQKTLFDHISEKYAQAGYKMPRLSFWNVNSRTNTIPVKENENGVALVSGFSPTIASMVFSSKFDPREIVVEKLSDKRYDAVEQAFKSVVK